MFEATELAAPPLAGAERCYVPARARTRGPIRTNEPPRRPLLPKHTGRWAHTRSVDGRGLPGSNHRRAAEPPPPLTWPGNAHNLRRETDRRSKHTSTQSQPHTETPARTLAAVQSSGTARHPSRATAPSTRTTKEARDWAIGGRHGQIRARMCGQPHLPHDAQIPDQRFTVTPARLP